jgi:protein-disulfide isomerase
MEPKQNNLTVPMAILAAGIIIAGAIFFTNGKGTADLPKADNGKNTATTKIEMRPIDQNTDHIFGNPNADAIILTYSDTECPFCKNFHITMQKIIKDYGTSGKVAWAYRNFPLDQLHSKARKEAEALECANNLGGNGKFFEFMDGIMAITPSNNGLDPTELPKIAVKIGLNQTAFETCLSSGKFASKVQADLDDGAKVGVNGTPFSIIITKTAISETAQTGILASASLYPPGTVTFSADGKKMTMNGALPYEFIKGALDKIVK